MSRDHARRNAHDRSIGEEWERRFDGMAVEHGWDSRLATAPEAWWKRSEPLPDRTVRRDGQREWHEIKHKKPTWRNEYGLEGYRIAAMLHLAEATDEPVLYTIHDWRLAGAASAEDDVENDLRHWRTVDIRTLNDAEARDEACTTYHAGRAAKTTCYYWPTTLWVPLARYWGLVPAAPEWPDGLNPWLEPERREAILAFRRLVGWGS